MQPIDADALKQDLLKGGFYPYPAVVKCALEAAPTIEQPQWISCAERLPTEEDSNEYDCVLAVKENYGKRLVDSWHYKTVCAHMKDFSYWMPFSFLPEPPKTEIR